MTDAPTVEAFTLAELIREAEREVAVRKTVYASRVAAGKMKDGTAKRQLGLMRAIVQRLRAEADGDSATR